MRMRISPPAIGLDGNETRFPRTYREKFEKYIYIYISLISEFSCNYEDRKYDLQIYDHPFDHRRELTEKICSPMFNKKSIRKKERKKEKESNRRSINFRNK